MLDLMRSDIQGLWKFHEIFVDLPRRAPMRFNHIPDGAGLTSSALWPLPFQRDVFKNLRTELQKLCYRHEVHRSLPLHIINRFNHSPFSPEVQLDIDKTFQSFFESMGQHFNVSIPPDQPFRLHALHTLAKLTDDLDAALILSLIDGVDLGIDQVIPPSGTWPQKQNEQDVGENQFYSFESNWSSAESDENTLKNLIDKEISDGFVTRLESLEEAKQQFGELFAIGKLGIATQQVDKPRLVLDSTISGLNPASNKAILEKYSYPKLSNLQDCIPTSVKKPNVLLNVDVKSAHKRIKVKPQHQGLLAFRYQDQLYHYKVLHFGGSCSAYYWTRVAGLLLRLVHRFLYTYHSGLVFVDDFVFGFCKDTPLLQASLVLMMMTFLQVPISWGKLELSEQITWIGWNINTNSDTVSITDDKKGKIIQAVRKFCSSGKFLRKEVEKLTGILLWISEMFPQIRWALGTLYTILSRPGIQLIRLNKQQIQFVVQHTSDDGSLTQFLEHPFVPQGSILQRLGKFSFRSPNVQNLRNSTLDMDFAWTTFLNCRSNRVQILEHETATFANLVEFFEQTTPLVQLSLHHRFTLHAGADAFADLQNFGLGAWLSTPWETIWCSVLGTKQDLTRWFGDKSPQAYMLSFEMIAQLLVLLLFRHQQNVLRGHDIRISTKLDNQAAEAILQQGFTQIPIPSSITRAVQQVSYQTRTLLEPYRASSADNTRADDLSRGKVSQEHSRDRIQFDIHSLFEAIFDCNASHLARYRGERQGVMQAIRD